MRTLTPAQRKAHLEKVRKDEAKRKQAAKPKPGQKGQQANTTGARTKAGTVGGGNVNTPRPSTPTRAKPQASNKPKPIGNGQGGLSKPSGTTGRTTPQSRTTTTRARVQQGGYVSPFAGQRDRNFQHIQQTGQSLPSAAPQARLTSPAIGAPVHASPQAFGSVARLADSPYVGSSAADAPRPSTPAQAVVAASESYRDGGKGLYQGSEAYRQAVGGSGNPLLNRFRQDMGLDPETGGRPEQLAPQETPTENPFAGIGDVRGLQINDTQPRIPQNAEVSAQKTNPQYQGNDEPGKLGQAEDPMRALAELLFRNKLKISVN